MAVLFGFTGSPDPTLMQRMDAALRHRSPRGTLQLHEEAGLSVGVRASHGFLGRRQGGCLQMDDDGHVLAAAGFAMASQPATDLLSAYRRHGPAFVKMLRGAFVLAVWDGRGLQLIRDGAGARTLYYAVHRGRLLFAVEIKGLTAAPGFERRLRPASLAQYLSFSFVPGERTMLEDVYELEAGQAVTVRGGRVIAKRRWFCFEDAAPPDDAAVPLSTARSDDDDGRGWVERVRSCIADDVAARLPGDGEPVGITLSGGLDSSAVTAEVASQHTGPVHTYSLHFGEKYPSELDYARAVAERCGTRHHELLIRPRRMLPALRRVVWSLDDPIGDPITAPNFELARRASSDVTLLFNGEGGDPLLGGPKNLPMMLQHWYGVPNRGAGFRERAYLASYRRAYEELSRLLSPDMQRRIDPAADLEGVLRPFFEAGAERPFLHRLLAINTRLKGAHLILPKVERMTAAWGITPHSPLFTPELIRLAFAMPPRMKLAAGLEKRVLKSAFADRLPASVINRPKSGMRVPVHFWFRGELRRYARHVLSPRRIKREGIFDHRRVRQLLRYDAEGGPGRYGIRLWMLLSFEIWRRLTIEGEAV